LSQEPVASRYDEDEDEEDEDEDDEDEEDEDGAHEMAFTPSLLASKEEASQSPEGRWERTVTSPEEEAMPRMRFSSEGAQETELMEQEGEGA
jgi:hypothetical protein